MYMYWFVNLAFL